jgi:hypothetical protein
MSRIWINLLIILVWANRVASDDVFSINEEEDKKFCYVDSSCDICDRKFTNANYLKSHMVVHERKKVSILLNFLPSPLTMRPNKLESLPLETLSSQVLEFEGKVRANPIEGPFRCFLLG